MKKLLILMLVLGLTSAANAIIVGSYNLYVNTSPPSSTYVPSEWEEGVDSQVALATSDTIWIGVHNSVQGVVGATQQGQFFLGILQPGVGPASSSWTGNWLAYKPPLIPSAPEPVNEYWGFMDLGYGPMELWLLTLMCGNPYAFNGIGVLDAKELHSDSLGTDTIYLIDAATGLIEDTLLIHSGVPEPMTIALLGLGALLLRRRK